MDAHPAAALFPMMGTADFAALRDDIDAHGQRDPIIVYRGQILDGRNRAKACDELGIAPETIKYDDHDIGGDPIAYVVSANLRRRHLSESQRSMIAADLETHYAAEAKKRMQQGGGDKKSGSAPVQHPIDGKGKAAEQAAGVMQVGARSVSSAKKVKNEGAKQVADAVRSGAVSVKVAETLVKAIDDKQQQAAIVREALKTDAPEKAIKQAIAPKNPPKIFATTDRVLNAIEHFGATVQWIYDTFGGVAEMLEHESWDAKETSIFRQHVNALPKLVGDLKTELGRVK